MKMIVRILCATIGAASFGCSAAPEGFEDTATAAPVGSVSLASKAGTCWDGVALPRPALDPIPSVSVSDAYTSFNAQTAAYSVAAVEWQIDYEAALAAQQDALENHPDYIRYKELYPEYVSALQPVVGKACTVDSECVSPSAMFPGICHIYYQHGQCTVDATQLPPIPQIPLNFSTPAPVPPAQPVFSCSDFTCASNYACELEVATGGIACVLNRCSAGGGNSGGGGKH